MFDAISSLPLSRPLTKIQPFNILKDIKRPINITSSSITEDGSILLSYSYEEAGQLSLGIRVNGLDIESSPFNVIIEPNVPSAKTSVASGPGLMKLDATNLNTFEVTPRGEFLSFLSIHCGILFHGFSNELFYLYV